MARVRRLQKYEAGATCSVNECDRRPAARGWCQLHYERWRKHGDPLTHNGPKHKPMPQLEDRELGWCAGIMEGEGSIRITKPNKRNYTTLEVQVVNTDIEMINLLHAWFGGMLKPASRQPRRRQAWRWCLYASRAAEFLSMIQPYLRTSRVLRKLELALEFQGQKHQGIYTMADKSQQIHYYQKMQELNVRGAPEQNTPKVKDFR